MAETYFSFFEMSEAFLIDTKELKKKYIANSKKYHPDFYTLQDGQTQEVILERSTYNNKAWKTLSNKMSRIEYLLRLHDAMPEEGQAQVPQEFLIKMMEINEQLMELAFDDNQDLRAKIVVSIDQLKEQLTHEGHTAMAAWDEDRESRYLELIRDYYLKSKYLARVSAKL